MTHPSPHHRHQHDHPQHEHFRHCQHEHGADGPDAAELAAVLDLDAEVLHEHLSELTGWLEGLAQDAPVRRILDLGSGTGTGGFALLRRFPQAEVTAVDASPELLDHLRARARALGVDDRVRTVQVDLDTAWPDFGAVDLAWSSAALHHLADPDRALRAAFAALRPGGLLAVVELDGFPLFLPDDLGLGRPGLESRCRAALADRHAAALPQLGADWGPYLTRAGFTVQAERTFSVRLNPPLPAATGRYAQTLLRRMRTALDGRISADDASVLDVLIDDEGPGSVLHRPDLTVRTQRTAWVARRPTAD
jgi:SAM-dependent methyltransferase